ncbi:MAG: hypothetical protein KY467_04405 [Gemmatimonadetes bacterium]|nr:hypothetical protein [Gemmatimonadota bacterium]
MPLPLGRSVPGPAVDLAQFQAQVRAGNFHVYVTRALTCIQRLRECRPREAREYARRAVLSLQEGDYAHTVKMPDGQLMDVYGKVIEEDGWYLKIEISMHDGQPGIVSCHPAAHDLATRSGVVRASTRRFQ